jgi:hypothetical protein
VTTLDWATVLAAVGEAQTGDRTSGRDRLLSCWTQTTPGDHAYRCVLAHYLADLQDSLDEEVAWDRTALEEFAHLQGDALTAVGIPDVAGLAPSLHLNLGDGYLRQGRLSDASEQLQQGQADVAVLADDGYGRMIRDGLTRLEARVAQAAERPMTSGVDPSL